jgi:hypothetical protein
MKIYVLRIVNQILKPSSGCRSTITQFYKSLARPPLSYGGESSTIKRRKERNVVRAGTRFMKIADITSRKEKREQEIIREL